MDPVELQLSQAQEQHRAGDPRAAEEAYRRILQQDPGHERAWQALGVLSAQAGKIQEALACAARGFRLDRGAELHFQLAVVLEEHGSLELAVEHYVQILESLPLHEQALARTAPILHRLGRLDDARDYYQKLSGLRQQDGSVWNNLGNVLQDLGDLVDAVRAYRRAISVEPGCHEARLNLAGTLRRSGDDVAARHELEAILAIHPDDPRVHSALGDDGVARGEFEQAERHFRLAAQSRPDDLAWALRADTVCPVVFQSTAQIDEYRQTLTSRLQSYQGRKYRLRTGDLTNSGAKPPLALAYHGRDDRSLKKMFARIIGCCLPEATPLPPASGKARIGFVVTASSEGIFCRGMAGVLRNLSPGRFETYLVCSASGAEMCRKALAGAPVEILTLPSSMDEAVRMLRGVSFDLLYHWEIGTTCWNYFLPFFRLARVQCGSWGWPVTSGIPGVDYFLSSRWLEPRAAAQHYSEQLVLLDHLPNYYDPPRLTPGPTRREDFGLPPRGSIYACVQNPRKIHPDFDALASDVLRRDPAGRLVLLSAERSHVTESLRNRLQRGAPDVFSRIHWAPRMSKADYLGLIALADVVLDTVHYGGGANTTYDALTLGVPVVTLPGEFHRGRYAMGAYRAMGIDHCIAYSQQQYVEIAVRLANDRGQRAMVSQSIAETRGVLFENRAAVHELEEFFDRAVEQGRRS